MMTPAAAAAAAAAAMTLELMEKQTTIFLCQAIGTVVAIVAAICIAAWQTRTSRKLVAEQHANAIALAERQHNSNVALANAQHEKTVSLMQAEWDRSNQQRDDARAEDNGFARAIFRKYSVALQELKTSAENPPKHNESGQLIYKEGVRAMQPAFEDCKKTATIAFGVLQQLEHNLKLTLRGNLASARFRRAFNNTANPNDEVEEASSTNPSLMKNWVDQRIEEYELALSTL